MSCSNKWVPFPPLKNENPIWHFFDAVFLSDTHAVATLLLLMLTGWSLFSNNHLPCLISIQRGYYYYIYVQFWKNPSICTRLSPLVNIKLRLRLTALISNVYYKLATPCCFRCRKDICSLLSALLVTKYIQI